MFLVCARLFNIPTDRAWHCNAVGAVNFPIVLTYTPNPPPPPHYSIFVGEFVDDLILGTGRYFSLEHAVQMVSRRGVMSLDVPK